MGERAVEVFWENTDEDILTERHSLAIDLQNHYGKRAAINEGYASILILFIDPNLDLESEMEIVRRLRVNGDHIENLQSNNWRLPVFYDREATDLGSVSQHLNIAPNQIIELHTSASYRVQFIGFLPGFPYLSGLPEQLSISRKQNPSPAIAQGSVAIAAGQCGIYPKESPGGWYVLGRCPLPFFDVNREQPSLLAIGDSVQFYAVGQNTFKALQQTQFDPKNYLDG
jgi:inhibitor of KinA